MLRSLWVHPAACRCARDRVGRTSFRQTSAARLDLLCNRPRKCKNERQTQTGAVQRRAGPVRTAECAAPQATAAPASIGSRFGSNQCATSGGNPSWPYLLLPHDHTAPSSASNQTSKQGHAWGRSHPARCPRQTRRCARALKSTIWGTQSPYTVFSHIPTPTAHEAAAGCHIASAPVIAMLWYPPIATSRTRTPSKARTSIGTALFLFSPIPASGTTPARHRRRRPGRGQR